MVVGNWAGGRAQGKGRGKGRKVRHVCNCNGGNNVATNEHNKCTKMKGITMRVPYKGGVGKGRVVVMYA